MGANVTKPSCLKRGRAHALTLTDVVIVLAMAVLVCGYALFSAGAMSETERRVRCASNLRTLGQAILLYSNENRGAYPRGVYSVKSVDTPVWGTPYPAEKPEGPQPGQVVDPFAKEKDAEAMMRPDANDVSSAMFLLLRTQDITSEVFVCPSTRLKPWDFGGGPRTALDWTNFAGTSVLRDHLSYAYANPYPSQAAVASGFKLNNSIGAEFAIAADMGPGDDALLTMKKTDGQKVVTPGNSLNHFGDGQNVLYGDGHVEFVASPFAGVMRDNIYTAGGPEVEGRKDAKAVLVGAPVDANDSVLLPTAKSIGYAPKPRTPLKPMTADQFRDAFAGKYTRQQPKAAQRPDAAMPPGSITLDGKELVFTSGPATIRYTCEPLGVRDDEYSIRLSAAGVAAVEIELLKADNGIELNSDQRASIGWAGVLMGTWKRE